MPPLVAVVGRSNSGKTTLVEGLVGAFVSRGIRVGTVKDYHGSQPIDVPGKDTDRHFRAGASAVVLRTPMGGKMFFRPREDTLEIFVARLFPGFDLVIAEGFKARAVPKIETARADLDGDLTCRGDSHLLAVVADFDADAGVPQFLPGDHAAVADFIERAVLEPARQKAAKVRLLRDGSGVDIDPHLENTIRDFAALLDAEMPGERLRDVEIRMGGEIDEGG
jgi:molybdopterin-guanine dinucleotide biosynthesis protein B